MNSTNCIIEEITAIQEYDLFEKLETQCEKFWKYI